MEMRGICLWLFAHLLLLSSSLGLRAQTSYPEGRWRGRVIDSLSSEPIEMVILTLYAEQTSQRKLLGYAVSDKDGRFVLAVPAYRGQLSVELALVGYHQQQIRLSPPYTEQTIRLREKPFDLDEVLVRAAPIQARGDTITFRADEFIAPTTHSLEDLIKRMPGLSVNSLGSIEWHGKGIGGILIEDMNMMGGRYRVLSQTLRAEQVRSLEVIEDYQAIKAKQGIVRGDAPVINVRLRNKNMLQPSGEATLGLGRLRGDKWLYTLRLNSLLVNTKTQILAVLGLNNADQNLAHGAHAYAETLGSTPARAWLPSNKTQPPSTRETLEAMHSGATMNQMLRLGEHSTLKYNLGYGNIRRKHYQEQQQELYRGETEDYLSLSESRYKQARDQQAYLTLNYEHNAPRTYLGNILELQGDWLSRHEGIQRNTLALQQESALRELRLMDKISYTRRRDNDNLSEWQLRLHYNTMPRSYIGVPGAGPYAYRQELMGRDAGFSTAWGYGWYLGGHVNLDADLQLDGRYLEGQATASSAERTSVVRGEVLEPQLSLGLRYEHKRLRWLLTLPLQIHLEQYRYTALSGQLQRYASSHYSPALRALLYYAPLPTLKLNASLSYSYRYMHDLSSFLLGPIHTSYDNRSLREHLLLPYSKGWRMLLEANYRRPIQGFFSRWQVIGATTEANVLTSRSVSVEGSSSSIVAQTARQRMLSSDLYLSQYIESLATTLSLELGGQYTQRPTLEGGRQGTLTNESWYLRPELSARPQDWLLCEFEGEYGSSLYSLGRIARRSHSYAIRSKLQLIFGQSWDATLRHSYSLMRQGAEQYPAVSFFDAEFSYKAKRWHYRLGLRNVLGVDVHRYMSYVQSDVYISSVYQRPRQLLFTLSYKL